MEPPHIETLRAFGATEAPVRVEGGQGSNYRSGNVILKPAKDDEETNWIAEFYLSFQDEDLRVPLPIRSNQGTFVVDGWQAWEALDGDHKQGRWLEKIKICLLFHQAIANVPRPSYFEKREQNPWVIADKAAWGEIEIEFLPRIQQVVDPLWKCLREVDTESQLIHGDFGGNILFSDELPPAVIDFSPYWRPVAFAVGVQIVDAIVWEGADFSLLEAGKRFRDFDQYLVRAVLRRIIELDTIFKLYGWQVLDQVDAHLPLIDNLIKRYS